MNRFALRALISLPVLAAVACGTDPSVVPAPERTPVEVTVAPVVQGGDARIVAARVVPAREAEIATRSSGTIERIAPLGTTVRAGTELVALVDPEVRGAVEAAEAGLRLAEADARRIGNLHAEGAASGQELDRAEAALAAARAELTAARARANDTRIPAPFAGVVTARMAEPGDLASPGRTLLRLASAERELRAALPAELRATVVPGSSARLPDGTRVRVLRVSPTLDPATRRFDAEFAAPASLEAGTVIDLAFELSADEAARGKVTVPLGALVRRGQLTGVFTVEADTLRLRWVRTGRVSADRVELLAAPAGLQAVVLAPEPGWIDGTPVAEVRLAPAADTGAVSR